MGLRSLGDVTRQHGQESPSPRTLKGSSGLGTCNYKAVSYQGLTVAGLGFPGYMAGNLLVWVMLKITGYV